MKGDPAERKFTNATLMMWAKENAATCPGWGDDLGTVIWSTYCELWLSGLGNEPMLTDQPAESLYRIHPLAEAIQKIPMYSAEGQGRTDNDGRVLSAVRYGIFSTDVKPHEWLREIRDHKGTLCLYPRQGVKIDEQTKLETFAAMYVGWHYVGGCFVEWSPSW